MHKHLMTRQYGEWTVDFFREDGRIRWEARHPNGDRVEGDADRMSAALSDVGVLGTLQVPEHRGFAAFGGSCWRKP